MAVEKVSLSLDVELIAKARQVAGRRGLSALVNDALRIKLQHERLRTLLVEMDAEFGPVPTAELARARTAWLERAAGTRRSRPSA
jgi:hypothetical protein